MNKIYFVFFIRQHICIIVKNTHGIAKFVSIL